ncbi:MAG: endonuclease MutS2 [Candidatus Kapaibacteriota bacterium]
MNTTLSETTEESILAAQTLDNDLAERSLEELEFPKVLERLADMAWSDEGREILLDLRPNPNLPELRAELERVNELVRLVNIGDQLPLEGFADIRPALHKSRIAGAFLNPSELLAVRDVMRSSRLTRSFFNTRREAFPAMAEFCTPLHENRLLEKHIADAIDDTGNVKDTASLDLARIRREIIDTSNKLRSRLQKILKKVIEDDVAQEEFITQRDGRFVLPMKTEYKRHIPGIIHSVSQTGSTVFVEPAETFDMNNELSLLHNEERREIERILTTLTGELAEDAEEFLRSVGILARMDAALAKARYAIEFDGMKPEITDENVLVLSNVRNPVLLHNVKREKPHKNGSLAERNMKSIIPLSIEFDGTEAIGTSSSAVFGHLISGPNAGGKTVAMKSIGLNIAMALSGIFPCGYCKTNFREVFSAIGDNQSIENDMSTFSSQISRLKEILMNASDSSLILVDEICSGTDPQEGSALAVGILEGLLARKAFFVVTTHQSSLKSYALTQNGIMNASMEFNTDKLEPTYKFLSGVPGNSYAFALARNIGLPPRVMEKAQEYLGDKHSTLEESIEVIQQYRREAEKLRRESEDVKRRAELRKTEYDQKFADFKLKYNDLMRLAKDEAAQIVANANKLVENTIRDLREAAKEELEITKRALVISHSSNDNKNAPMTNQPMTNDQSTNDQYTKTLADVRREFEAEKNKIQNAAEKQALKPLVEEPDELDEGDTVTMEDFATPGVIVALDREAGSAVVEFDAVKFRTTLANLKRAGAKQIKQAKKTQSSGVGVNFDAKTEIDLRGMYSDEAIKTVEQAIASALTGNVHALRIIHGKGTGALRQAVQQHLQHHPAVKSFRNGLLTEGGAGVTVVELL